MLFVSYAAESHNEFCHVVRGRCQHVTFTLNFTIVESKVCMKIEFNMLIFMLLVANFANTK